MSFNTALSAGQKTKIRSASYASYLQLTLCSNTVVFAGRINSDLTTPTSWAQFNYNSVSVGAYTDVEVDEVVLIGTANDITRATYRGRIRKAPTSSILYVSESSMDFDVGDYFWVIYAFDPTYKLSRPSTSDPATAVELVDYDLTLAPPRASVVGLRTAYVNRVDPATSKLRVAFDVSGSFAVASGDSITAYQFTFKAGTYAVVSGSLATAVVTVDFDADTEQWGQLTVTTANGQVKTRRFYVRAYGTSSQADTGADETSIQIAGDLSRGWTLSAAYFTGVDSVLNRTLAVAWRENENYGGVAGGLDSNNIAFVGWLLREEDSLQSDRQYSVLSSARFEFTGVGPRMQRLRAQEVAIRIASSPSEWGDIVNLTWWRAIAHFLDRYSTITVLCDLDFSEKANAYLFPDFGTQGGNLFAAVQGIAQQVAANLEFAPDGRIEVNISAEYLTNLGRAGLVTVLDLTAQDCFTISRSLDGDAEVGIVDAVGASYNSASGQVSTYAALAPGHAQGESAGSDTLPGPVLAATPYASAALVDLKQRAGNRFEVANDDEILEIDHPDGFTFLIPSRYQYYTLTIDTTVAGANGVSRIIYDTGTQWLLEAVSYARQGNGTTGVRARYRKLPRIGDPGDNVTQVAANEIEDQLPDFGDPAFNWDLPELTFPDDGLESVAPAQLLPPKGLIAATNGQHLIVASTTNVFWLKAFITLTRPQAVDITPPDLGSYTVRSVALSPFFSKTAVPAYVLASDGTNSAVWYTPNAAAGQTSVQWTKGVDFVGVYTIIRTTNIEGTVLVYSPYSPGTGASSGAITVTFDSGGYSNYSFPNDWATEGPTTVTTGGNPDNCAHAGPAYAGEGETTGVQVYITLPSVMTVTKVEYDIRKLQPVSGDPGQFVRLYDSSGVFITSFSPSFWEEGAWATTGTGTISVANVRYVEIRVGNTFANAIVEILVDNIEISYNIPATNTGTRKTSSADNGATWDTQLLVDVSAPGFAGGFDVQRAGSVNYAAAPAKVRKATALDGSYSDFVAFTGANPVCVIIPYFRRNSSTKQTTASDPDVIVALDQADSGGGTLYWVNGTTGVKTDITPVAGMTFSHPDCITVRYGNLIAVWGTVAGQQKLYVSTNGGTSWTFISNISSAGKIRCRRDDTRPSPNGQIYLCQANVIDYSSKWFSNALYPRTMPVTGITMFDVLY